MSLYSTFNLVYFDHRKNIHVMYFYKREMFNWNKNLMQTWSPIDRGSKGVIEYTIIPCRRLNRQVTLAVEVEHVQTPGGQTTFDQDCFAMI